MEHLQITKRALRELKKLYATAVNDKKDTFEFQGKTLVTGYAKYLIEYLEGQKDRIPE